MSTFLKIKEKVRLLTQNPTALQLSEAALKEYINTFYLYDFPQIVQTNDLTSETTFATTPNVERYSSTTLPLLNNLSYFIDFVVMTDQPIYIAGRPIQLFQDQQEFYNYYGKCKTLGSIGTGDGVTTNFVYNLPTTVLHVSVVIGTLNAAGEALIVVDRPNIDAYQRYTTTGNLVDQAGTAIGTINYLTGAIDVTFGAAPANGADITYEMFAFQAAMPTGILLYANTFFLRPVPDKVYEVKFKTRLIPTAFNLDTDTPLVTEWWQYIAYGAAKKIFEDRTDLEGVSRIMPEFTRQQILVMRKTNLNKSKERTSTIFSGSDNLANSWSYFNHF